MNILIANNEYINCQLFQSLMTQDHNLFQATTTKEKARILVNEKINIAFFNTNTDGGKLLGMLAKKTGTKIISCAGFHRGEHNCSQPHGNIDCENRISSIYVQESS